MGNFDVDSKYDENLKISLTALCKEILDEEQVDERLVPENTIYQKFKDGHGTGLLDKLKKLLDFDMEQIARHSKKECFDMLKILKLLFHIEKEVASDDNIRITNILAKPRLANISGDVSPSANYNDVVQNLYDQIRSLVDDADIRCAKLEKADLLWKFITVQTFDYVLSPQALSFPEDARKELTNIKEFLENKVYNKLKEIPASKKSQSEGVMNTFFNMLACHRLLCMENTKIVINQQVTLNITPTPEYIVRFKKTETFPEVSWDILNRLNLKLSGKNDGDDARVNSIFDLITYDSNIPEEDVTHYRYAINHVRTVVQWWRDYLQIEQEDSVSVDLLCVAIQEIVWCKKNKPKITHDYMKYKTAGKSMMSALSNPEEAAPIVVQAWMTRLENRLCVNLGTLDLLHIKREIDNIIFEIKKIIYSYHSLEDLLFVNSFIVNYAEKNVISREHAIMWGQRFSNMLLDQISSIDERDLYFHIHHTSILNMFREFIIHQTDCTPLVKLIAETIVHTYKSSDENEVELIYDFRFPASHPVLTKERRLTLKLNKETNIIACLNYEYVTEAYENEMQRLGLELFTL